MLWLWMTCAVGGKGSLYTTSRLSQPWQLWAAEAQSLHPPRGELRAFQGYHLLHKIDVSCMCDCVVAKQVVIMRWKGSACKDVGMRTDPYR